MEYVFDRIIGLIKKYKEAVLYLLFGGLTTLVNFCTYYACAHLFYFNTTFSTLTAWFVSVAFAYVTNRICVFNSDKNTFKEIIAEISKFFSARLLTGFLDLILMYIFVDILFVNDVVMKLLTNIVVIVLNYIFSKLIIFTKK